MSDVIITIGGDATEFWAKMREAEQSTKESTRRIGDGFGDIGRRIDGMTEPYRKFNGALRSSLGLVAGFMGTFAIVGGLVVGAHAAMTHFADEAERAREAARAEADARRDALRTTERDIQSRRLAMQGGLGAGLDRISQEANAMRERLRTEFQINEAIEKRVQLESDIARLESGRVARSDFQSLNDALFGVNTQRRLSEVIDMHRGLNAQIEQYSRQLAEIRRYEDERLRFHREMVNRQSEVEEMRLVIELLAAEGLQRESLEQVEQANHIERMRRIAELAAEGSESAANMERLEEQRHRARMRQIREEDDAQKRLEEQRKREAEEELQLQQARNALSTSFIEADVLSLRGEDEKARRLRIQLELERDILETKRDQTLTDEERARRIELLNERARLRLDQAPDAARPETRTLQGGFIGAARIAERALGRDDPALRRERLAQQQLAKLSDLVRELTRVKDSVIRFERDGIPTVLN